VLSLQVQPRASCNQLVGLQDDVLKVKLTSPPVEGAANKACCAYLAKLFGVAKSSAVLISGARSRQKRILLSGVDMPQAEAVLVQHLPPS